MKAVCLLVLLMGWGNERGGMIGGKRGLQILGWMNGLDGG